MSHTVKPGKRIDFTVGDMVQDNTRKPPASSPARADQLKGLSGSERAAKLLLALGPDQAAAILRELGEKEIEKLINDMARIRHITSDEKQAVLAEFNRTVEHIDPDVRGGPEKAREILALSLGEKKADEILSRVKAYEARTDFRFLEDIDPGVLASMLSMEHPQIAAVALSSIQPRAAAAVMKLLPAETQSEVATRIARSIQTNPEALDRVAKVLREKFERRSQETFSEAGGPSTLANILNHMDRGTEDQILGVLGTRAPDIIENVKDLLYTFEELIQLSPREMRLVVSKVNDDEILSSALRGAGEDIRRHFFNALSQNRAADVLEEMDRRGALSVREINEARQYILGVARKLDEDGAIVIKKEKEEYV